MPVRSNDRRIRLAGIFGLALFVIIIDAYRVQQNYSSHASQFSRAVWISVATLGSAVVANVPSIYSNMRMSRSTRPRRRGVGYEKTPVPFWRAASDYKSDVSESSSKPVIMVERKIESRYDPA